MKNTPLFLPNGSIRAIIILILTIAILLLVSAQKEVPEIITTIWAGAIGWYFGGKIDMLKNKNDK